MKKHCASLAPDDRLLIDFPWQAWGAGWLGIINGILWIFYEAVLPSPAATLLLLKYFLLGIVFITAAFGVWNLKPWARCLLMAAAAADLALYAASAMGIVNMDILGILNSAGRKYSIFLPILVFLSGPIGDILILAILSFAGGVFRRARE